MVEVELKKWGNSLGVIVPLKEIKGLGLTLGDRININIVKKKRIDGFGIAKGLPSFEEEKEPHSDLW